MARKILIQVRCDNCGTIGEEDSMENIEFTRSSEPRKKFEVDLCFECISNLTMARPVPAKKRSKT